MNLHYAKFVNGQLTYAPSAITTPRGDLIVNPKRLSYLQAGYKQLIDEPPVAPRGKSAALSRYEETADTITAVYKLVPCAESPRTFSKLRLVAALDAQGLWQSFRDWMVEQEYYDLFLARALAGGFAVASRPSLASLGAFPRTSAKIILLSRKFAPPPSLAFT